MISRLQFSAGQAGREPEEGTRKPEHPGSNTSDTEPAGVHGALGQGYPGHQKRCELNDTFSNHGYC